MSVEIVHTEAANVSGLAVVSSRDEVWVTFHEPWWHLASWIWWALSPGKKAWLLIGTADGRRVRVRAWRASRTIVKVRETPGAGEDPR